MIESTLSATPTLFPTPASSRQSVCWIVRLSGCLPTAALGFQALSLAQDYLLVASSSPSFQLFNLNFFFKTLNLDDFKFWKHSLLFAVVQCCSHSGSLFGLFSVYRLCMVPADSVKFEGTFLSASRLACLAVDSHCGSSGCILAV